MCLRKRTRVFCWIFTTGENLLTRSTYVENTWAQHCDGHVFFVCRTDRRLLNTGPANLNVVHFTDVVESRTTLYSKTLRAIEWMASKQLFDKYDWFMKADDDTFLIVEHFKDLVAHVRADEPHYVGRPLLHEGDKNDKFMSGGAGFAMSRGALRMLHRLYPTQCPDIRMPCHCDDLIIGRCFRKWNVSIVQSCDQNNKQRFFPVQPDVHFSETVPEDYEWLVRDAQPIV